VQQPPLTPTAPQTPPTIAPEDSQIDDQSGTDGGAGGGGGVKPPGGNDLLPDNGVGDQPEVQQPEQEGQDQAGPLT
jgi:hypothetical protein